MTHIWLRAEQRDHETRVGLTHQGARALVAAGFKLTVEASVSRVLGTDGYQDAGAVITDENTWVTAPADAIILGLKELPDDGTPLIHRHVMFGHAYKGQRAGRVLLDRFSAGGGVLYDLEYLTDDTERRVAAFGYWAGFAGAAVSLLAWAAQLRGELCPAIGSYANQQALLAELRSTLRQSDLSDETAGLPKALVIGALGRVGSGATDLCQAVGLPVTRWDLAETAHGGPFPEVLEHELFLNCILAHERTSRFLRPDDCAAERRLRVVGDIACDPDSEYNPIAIYSQATTWDAPVLRVHNTPPLDVMAIDNLPSLLPFESSEDFAGQLLPYLLQLDSLSRGVWGKARALFDLHSAAS